MLWIHRPSTRFTLTSIKSSWTKSSKYLNIICVEPPCPSGLLVIENMSDFTHNRLLTFDFQSELLPKYYDPYIVVSRLIHAAIHNPSPTHPFLQWESGTPQPPPMSLIVVSRHCHNHFQQPLQSVLWTQHRRFPSCSLHNENMCPLVVPSLTLKLLDFHRVLLQHHILS